MIQINVAPGELFDRISILEIKASRINDPIKLGLVMSELKQLHPIEQKLYVFAKDVAKLESLYFKLKSANLTLWNAEDQLRKHETESDFGEHFTQLARSIYKTNDLRAELKRKISELLGAEIYEVKSYA